MERKPCFPSRAQISYASTRKGKLTKELNEWVLSRFGSGGLVFCTAMIDGDLHDSLFVVPCPQSKQEIHRRSARLRSTKYKAPASEKKVSTKGKGRRHIFKLKNVRVEFILLGVTVVTVLHHGYLYLTPASVCVSSLSSADQSTRICCNYHHIRISLL